MSRSFFGAGATAPASQTPAARHNRLLIPSLSVANFAIGMGAFSVIGVLTPISVDFGISAGEAGMVMTAYAISYAILSPLLVALSGTIDRRSILLGGMVVFMLGMVVSALAPDPVVLNLGRIVSAAGAGVLTPVAAAVAVAASPPENRGKVLASVFFGLTLAQALGVPVGSYLGYTFGWRVTIGVSVLIAFLSLIVLARAVPRGMAFQVNSLATLGNALSDWRSMLSVLVTATFLSAIYIVYTFIAPLFEQSMGFGRGGIAFMLFMFGIGAVGGNWLGGKLTDRIGAAKTLAFITVMQIILLPLFSLLPLPIPIILALMLFWPVFGWSIMVPQQARLIAQTPQRQQVVLALNAAAIYVGASIGPVIGAMVIERFGLNALGFAASLTAVMVLAHLVLSEWLAHRPQSD